MGFAAYPASLPLRPRRRGERTASGPCHHRSDASCALTASSRRAWRAGSCGQKTLLFPAVLLSTGHFWCRRSFSLPPAPRPFVANISLSLSFLLPSPCSVEASRGRRWPELLVGGCDPCPSQPYRTATVHLLGRLCPCQHELTGHLQRSRKYLLPGWRGF